MKRWLLYMAGLTVILVAVMLISCKKQDTTAPVLTLKGAASIDVVLGTAYVDPGATATDNKDGDLTSAIKVNNPVDTLLEGNYQVTYSASDAAGNVGSISRQVHVKNSLDSYAGSYNATDDRTSDGIIDSIWTEAISASPTVNNQLIFAHFASYAGCTLKININNGIVSYPDPQTFQFGVSPHQINKTFSAITGTATSNLITVHYHEADSTIYSADGVDTFTK